MTKVKAPATSGAQTHRMARLPSPAMLMRAPHRLLFFIGASNLLLAMLWWVLWLGALRGLWTPQPPSLPPAWLHALLMQYMVLPSFIFGFLLTVFPRWMNQPELPRSRYAPVGLGLFGGQALLIAAACGWAPGLRPGLLLALAGWSAGLIVLGHVLRAAGPNRNWHARACFTALLLGWLGLLAFIAVACGHATLMPVHVALGTFGMLLPIYLTVAHRMIPFFANNVVTGYVPWRPLRWLAVMWALMLLRLLLMILQAEGWLWLADAPLLALSIQALWHWWPRGPMPGLLAALFLALAWLPISVALYLLQDVGHLLGQPQLLGRAPLHALAVGLFGSLLVAMVTRVTQGHSGRPLVMPAVAWFAFVALQAVAIMRIAAELMPDAHAWHFAAAIGWLLALAPWVARLGWIYLSPRRDGKPG
ncbi:NnrS family protein [Stenotrophomonas maltophilia]|uniref:NnrS family protein n=1 Tax=Stenotrophomonas maltophilia TaxID=40324 RepID=UPI00066E41E4